MKIGIISDTHIKDPKEELPEQVFELFRDVDHIIHAGDLIDYCVVNMLEKVAPVTAVYGNMDSSVTKADLPQKKMIFFEGKNIGVTHGDGPPWGLHERVTELFLPQKPDIIIYGHSHCPETKTLANGILYINPGSPTDKVYAEVNSVVVLEINDGDVTAQIKYL